MGEAAEALARGVLPNLDAVAQVRRSRSPAGRAIDVQLWDGLSVRVLPDRGLDVLNAWFAGVPLAWISSVGETAPLTNLDGMAWSDAFGGGLVTTCGLRNVGMPSEGHGLHGTFSHLPAADVECRTEVDHVVVTGTVDDLEHPPLRVERAMQIGPGGRLDLRDVTTNRGDQTTPAPVLYHLNFGYPLWAGDARLAIDSAATTARDTASESSISTWDRPHSLEDGPERVLEHRVRGRDGWGSVRLASPPTGIDVEIRWDMETLPRLHQWIDPNPGMNVLGVEPANCSTSGRAADREAGRLPHLAPGESRATQVIIEARRR